MKFFPLPVVELDKHRDLLQTASRQIFGNRVSIFYAVYRRYSNRRPGWLTSWLVCDKIFYTKGCPDNVARFVNHWSPEFGLSNWQMAIAFCKITNTPIKKVDSVTIEVEGEIIPEKPSECPPIVLNMPASISASVI